MPGEPEGLIRVSRRVNPERRRCLVPGSRRVNPERRRCLVPGEPEGVIRSAGERMPYGTGGACVRSNVPVPRECRLSAIPPDIR